MPTDKVVGAYTYHDPEGQPLYQVVRYDPKAFRQRRPNPTGGRAIWNLDGVTRVLYHLPALVRADPETRVVIVEGEKDADALTELGFLATCNLGGAGKWKDEYSETLRDRRVTIIPDNDDPGRAHATQVARMLLGLVREVRILELPDLPAKGDVSDWIAGGGNAVMLEQFIESAPMVEPDVSDPFVAELARRALKESEYFNDPTLEQLVIGRVLAFTAVQRKEWYPHLKIELFGDSLHQDVIAALIEQGTDQQADVVLALQAVKQRRQARGLLTGLMVADLLNWQHRAEEHLPMLTLDALRSLDDWRMQRIAHQVQVERLRESGAASVTHMRRRLDEANPILDLERKENSIEGDAFEAINRLDRDPNEVIAGTISTGIEYFDQAFGRFEPGDLVVVGGRPSLGKTVFGKRMLDGMLMIDTEAKGFMLSLEMPRRQLFNRMLADHAEVAHWRIRQNSFENEEQKLKVAEAALSIAAKFKGRLFVYDESDQWRDCQAAIHRHMSTHPETKMIVVDYLQLVGGVKGESREQVVGEVTRILKAIAKKYKLVVVAIAQLNRKVGMAKPTMANLRESGQIEQHADWIFLLWCPDMDEEQERSAEIVKLMLILAKARNTETGMYPFDFNKPYQRMEPAPARKMGGG